MKQIRKILRDKRGEGYIDVAVMVLCVMLVIALGVRLFPILSRRCKWITLPMTGKGG